MQKLLRPTLIQFSQFNNLLGVCWFLGKNLSNFVPSFENSTTRIMDIINSIKRGLLLITWLPILVQVVIEWPLILFRADYYLYMDLIVNWLVELQTLCSKLDWILHSIIMITCTKSIRYFSSTLFSCWTETILED